MVKLLLRLACASLLSLEELALLPVIKAKYIALPFVQLGLPRCLRLATPLVDVLVITRFLLSAHGNDLVTVV